MLSKVKLVLKQAFAPILYHGYPVSLQMERVYLWLDVLAKTQGVPGDVIEMGVAHGGTSIMARKFLKRLASQKQYWAYDTFNGFVEGQIEREIEKGLDRQFRTHFSANSKSLVRRIFEIHGVDDIKLVEGDVAKVGQYPDGISAALLDVDLAEPIYHALKNIVDLVHDDGIIMVDDCHEIRPGFKYYRAEEGVKQFLNETGLSVNFIHNCAFITKGEKFTNAYLVGDSRRM